MAVALTIVAALLLIAVIVIQVLYLRALKRMGVEITLPMRIVSYFNIGLLVALFTLLVTLALMGRLPILEGS